jgi:hypothetical protein
MGKSSGGRMGVAAGRRFARKDCPKYPREKYRSALGTGGFSLLALLPKSTSISQSMLGWKFRIKQLNKTPISNALLRTPNAKRQTPNAKRQTPNAKR